MELIREDVETKASSKDLTRLHEDFITHLKEFMDLKKKFNATVDTQHKL